MNTILSICIPTYNRKNYLKQCLETMLPQVTKFGIPIFVSDNASEDGTEEMVKKLSSEYRFLFYKKQKMNVGVDINMLEVISLAQSKYAWWFGDDDVLIDGGIQYLLDILNKNDDLSFVLLNAKHISHDLKTELNGTTIRIIENTFYSDCRSFFKNHCFRMPFGTLIVNTNKFQGLDFARFIGTSHAYSGAVLDYLAKEFSETRKVNIMVVAKPVIYLRRGEKTWSNYSAKLKLVEIPEWFEKLDITYHPEAQKIRRLYVIKQSKLRSLLSYRGIGQINFYNLHYLSKILPFKGKINAFLVSLLPAKAAKAIYHFARSVNKLILRVVRNS